MGWLRDLHKRELLDLDPPYQRRAVWNKKFKEFFIETVLLQYPAPPIFLHENIKPDGTAVYSVIDGKQRLTTVFEFTDDSFPVSQDSVLEPFRGKLFSELDDGDRRRFWGYEFLVEFIPTIDRQTLNNIFDRINRNVARLTRQELRHAKYDGAFAKASEEMTELIAESLPDRVPAISRSSRRQMKDVELTAQLLLLAESGPQSFSQDELDEAYTDRDQDWPAQEQTQETFEAVLSYLSRLWEDPALMGAQVRRLRNQADFYSFFGAVASMIKSGDELPEPDQAVQRLEAFITVVRDEGQRSANATAERYFQAARSASNDLKQRMARIEIIRNVLIGD